MNSRPCGECVHWLLYYGIKKVIYSDVNGTYTEKKVCDLIEEPQHISGGRKRALMFVCQIKC